MLVSEIKRKRIKTILIVMILAAALIVGFTGVRNGWELQRRLMCAANLKTWGENVRIYGNNSVAAAKPGLVAPGPSVCPTAGAANYVFVGVDRSGTGGNTAVIGYEPKSNHKGEGGNILFDDGHVEFVKGGDYDRRIESARNQKPNQ